MNGYVREVGVEDKIKNLRSELIKLVGESTADWMVLEAADQPSGNIYDFERKLREYVNLAMAIDALDECTCTPVSGPCAYCKSCFRVEEIPY